MRILKGQACASEILFEAAQVSTKHLAPLAAEAALHLKRVARLRTQKPKVLFVQQAQHRAVEVGRGFVNALIRGQNRYLRCWPQVK